MSHFGRWGRSTRTTQSQCQAARKQIVRQLARMACPNCNDERPTPKQKNRSNETIDVLAEGVTELLHPKVHGPFLASIEEDTVVSCLVTILFVAPLFRHEPENTDFLMILTPHGGQARAGQRDSMGVILREMPTSMFVWARRNRAPRYTHRIVRTTRPCWARSFRTRLREPFHVHRREMEKD
jgi:Protein of unknown function (DUF3591)